jgi:hypothetical protein
MTYRVEVVKRLVYRVEAASPEDAQALALLAAAGTDAPRLQAAVQADVVVMSRALLAAEVAPMLDETPTGRVP